MTVFKASRPDQLPGIRTAEDIFAIVGYRRGLDASPVALERIRAAVHDATYIAPALEARVRMLPGSKAGQRLRFRVIARMAGDHEFRRVDFKHAVERGMGERGDRKWRLDEDGADVEFWATLLGGEFILAIRLNDDRMRRREYKVAQMPGSLRPAAAAALAWLSAPAATDVVLDPMCGAGTILIERAHMGRYQQLIGGDLDAQAIADARANVGPRYKPIEFHHWDATALPLGDAGVDKLVTNLPWGLKHGTHTDNRRLYPRLVSEFMRVTRKGGTIVMLTAENHLMRMIIARGVLTPTQILRVSILGASAAIYVCRA